MKGIILAGGSGTRLYTLKKIISKQHLLVVILGLIVLFACKNTWISRDISIYFNSNSSKTIEYQIFYDNSENVSFSEELSIKKTISNGENKVKIVLPTTEIKHLRIDFGSNPGQVSISNLKLHGNKWVRIKDLNKFWFNDINSYTLSTSKNTLKITSDKLDPYIVFQGSINLYGKNNIHFNVICIILIVVFSFVHYFSNISKEKNYVKLIEAMIMSAFITYLIYNKFHFTYSSIDNFYSGVTIYDNFNKSIDKNLPYIYTIIALILYFMKINLNKIKGVFISCISYVKIFLKRFLVYIKIFFDFLNSKTSIKKILLVSFEIILSLAILYSLCFTLPNDVPIDNYHYGERLVWNWLLGENGYRLYSDFYPPHGISDVLPSWFGSIVFHDNSVYGVRLGESFNYYLQFVIMSALAFKILPRFFALLGIFLAIKMGALLISIYFLCILFLITNKTLKENFNVYVFAVCVSSYLLYILSPTYGAPYILSLAIPFIYRLKKYCEITDKKEITFFVLFFTLTNALVLLIFKDFFFNNFLFILNNFKSNLISFGNSGLFKFEIFIKIAQYILLPIIIVCLINELKQGNKNIDRIMLLSILITYPFFISSYSLGRLDGSSFCRTGIISYPILIFVIPFLLNQKETRKLYVSYISIMAIVCCQMIYSTSYHIPFRKNKQIHTSSTIYKNGKAVFNADHLKKLNDIHDFISKNVGENYSFLDLTNQGALYFYLNKIPLLPYLAYYNIPSPTQDEKCAEKLKQNLPDIVLIKGYNIMHDSLPVPIRVNSIYKTLLLSNKYMVLSNGIVTILKKTNYHNFSSEEITLLDDALGFQNIKKLPDVYGSSIKKLSDKLIKLDIPYEISRDNNTYTIKFNKMVNGKDLNYLYLKTDEKKLDLIISICDKNIEINSESKVRLIPLDIRPTTLLNSSIKEIKIISNEDFSSKKVKFYKRKCP